MKQVVVDKLLTSYTLSGKGKLILLLHGWGDSKESFHSFEQQLARQFQVVSLDLPGFGKTQMPSEVWDLDNYAQFVSDFLTKLKLGEPQAIIGHSNGGALAIRGLSKGLLSSKALVLIASSGIRTGNTFKRIILKLVAKVGKLLTFWLPESKRKKLRKSLYGVAGSDMLVAPHLQETFKKTVRQDIQADAGQLKLPTLLLYTRDDKAVPFSDGQKLASLISGSKFVEIQGGDHFIHQSAETDVLAQIEEFLNAY